MSVGSFLSKIREWFFRSSAMRQARAAAAGPAGLRARAHAQAQLLVEVARRVAEPVEALPPGSRAAVQLTLSRDAAYWALVAMQPDGSQATDVATLWNEAPADRLQRAAGGVGAAEAVRAAVADDTPAHALEATEDDAARVRTFAGALLAELDAPRRRIERVLFQRWWRLSLLAVLVLVILYGARVVSLGPNLAEGKPFRASTNYAGCSPSSPCDGIFFHTEQEASPWVEIDLGAPKAIKRIEVANRGDCCQDRAVPLVAEVSTDRINWKEVARREAEFTSWTAKFPKTKARYVRMRVTRPTQFHLKEVAVR